MRSGSRPAAAIGLLVTCLCGCDAAIEPPPGDPVPVIQALLIAGDSQQIAWVEWRVPADSAFGREVRPVDPAVVQVSLILPNGGSVPFSPSLGVPGRFEAAAMVSPGASYRLTGTIAGTALTAETRVPDSLTIRAPAQDTVDGASCVERFVYCELPYDWSALGASTYMYLQSTSDTSRLVYIGSTRDSTGALPLLRDTGTERLTVLALEDNAAAFLTVMTPKSSVHGVFGMFGGATRAQRWIVWP
jgi:hypothetical protein